MLSALAVIFYWATATACVVAARKAIATHRPRRMSAAWMTLAALFVALGLARAFEVEAAVTQWLRLAARTDGAYETRSAWQAPLAVVVAIIASLTALGLLSQRRRMRGRAERLMWWASMAGAGMVWLSMLRIVSFHAIDRLLYAKPIHLNWIIDLGLTGIVLASAVLTRIVLMQSSRAGGHSSITRSRQARDGR
ncbi:hypothetical protein A6F68_00904 [Tsuneonella dongtanensis]|uniref:Uncharacterized protein n=1 Tax=Tsuneonella dongtanensis TaxID=692370 RepID=A0A1B2AB86_9SPHN|nr:hypothetical protein [Tsuneonella dongtanensis]ANY19430.1 hypothetical protein A6F68_00904 [Tsuneonella dongtanensis]